MPRLAGSAYESYHFDTIIAQGTFATVYLANSPQIQGDVAIKCIEKLHVPNYRRESEIFPLLEHKNVIHLIDVFETEELMCYVLEYCKLDLFQTLDRYGVFTQEVVLEIFNQILDGLIHCHSRSVYHRDLKPENILVGNDYTARICDFGLSTFDSWSHEYGCGSLRYMSPESYLSPNETLRTGYSPSKSDVWSLGIILINMISGKNPWHSATDTDVYYNSYIEDPSYLKRMLELNADCVLNQDFETLLKKILDPNPHRRISLTRLKREFVVLNSLFESH